MDRVVEYLLAIPIAAYPVALAVGTWRGRLRLYKCTVDARYDLRMRDAYPEMHTRPASPLPEPAVMSTGRDDES